MISRSQRILGLDIGSNSVKGVELSRTGDRFSVTGYAQQEISGAGTLKDAIVAVLREGRFKSKQVVSSVSGRSVIVRYVTTPSMKPEELKSSMRFEADKYIPFDVNEVILDCAPLDDPTLSGKADMRVVLVAVKKEVVNEHVRILQDVGLFPYVIDVDCFALGNAFELASKDGVPVAAGGLEAPSGDDKATAVTTVAVESAVAEQAGSDTSELGSPMASLGEETEGAKAASAAPAGAAVDAAVQPLAAGATVYALVDIGAQKTNINIMDGFNSYFTREVYIGGEDMTEAVAKFMGVSPLEAETVKRNGEKEGAVLEAVTQTLDDLANEIFLSFDYFENQFETQIRKVYLSGGGSRLKGITGILAQTLGREVLLWDPLAGIDVALGDSQAAKLRECAPQLAVAMGLASRLRKV